MDARALLRRLLSPTGFALVGLCFLLPFVTVSCDAKQGPIGTATYSGRDLVAGGRPALEMSDRLRRAAESEAAGHPETASNPPPTEAIRGKLTPLGGQPFLTISLVLVVAGLAATAIPRPWFAALVRGGVAVLSAVFLIGGEILAGRAARARMDADLTPLIGAAGTDPARQSGVAIGTAPAYGFWLALALLLALAVAGGVEFALLSRRPAAPPTPAAPLTPAAPDPPH
jgi:hypothetical protein